MEDTLWALYVSEPRGIFYVLILVLMEDTLWDVEFEGDVDKAGLNPCFNGRYSLSAFAVNHILSRPGLNPCFNGRYSLSYENYIGSTFICVLILVLMEDTLRE